MNEEKDFDREFVNRQINVNNSEERSAIYKDIVFEEDLVSINIDAQTPEEVIKILSDKLLQKGYVTNKFFEAVINREKEFPTGLPTIIPVALPHTDAVYCKGSAISVGILKTPVSFREMGNPHNYLPVEIVFLLVLVDSNLQTQWLQRLVKAFKENDFLKKLKNKQTKQEIVEFINQIFNHN